MYLLSLGPMVPCSTGNIAVAQICTGGNDMHVYTEDNVPVNQIVYIVNLSKPYLPNCISMI